MSSRFNTCCVFACCLFFSGPAPTVLGQEDDNNTSTATTGQSPAVTSDSVATRLEQLGAPDDADAESIKEARRLYEQAQRELTSLKNAEAALQQFQQQIGLAADSLEQAKQNRTAAQNRSLVKPSAENRPLNELEQELATRVTALKDARDRLTALDAEPKRRANRLREIAELLRTARDDLEAASKELDTIPATDLTKPKSLANHTYLTARMQATAANIEMLEAEKSLFEATNQQLQIDRDLAAADVAYYGNDEKQWRELVDRQRKSEAQRQAEQAEDAAKTAHPALASLAGELASLTSERTTLAEEIAKQSQELEQSREYLADLNTDFERAQNKVEAGGMSRASGQLLRRRESDLPRIQQYHRIVYQRNGLLKESRFKEYEYQDQRLALADIETTAEQHLRQIQASRSEVGEQLQDLLTQKRDILDGLIRDFDTYGKILLELNEISKNIIEVAGDYRSFIEERVLWIRSADPISHRDLPASRDAGAWLLGSFSSPEVARALWSDFRINYVLIIPALCAFGILIWMQRPARLGIHEIGEQVQRRGFHSFSPTARAIILTVAIAATWPILLRIFGWRLSSSLITSDSTFISALSLALFDLAAVWLPLELLRQTARPNGLAANHFEWPDDLLVVLRRQLHGFIPVGLPLVLVISLLAHQTQKPLWSSSLGRLAFMVLMAFSTLLLYRLLRSNHGVIEHWNRLRSSRVPELFRHAISLAPCLLAASLILLAGIGYYQTALVLAAQLFESAVLMVGLLVLYAILNRWVLMRRRLLTIEQLRQRREALAADNLVEVETEASPLLIEQSDEVNLATVSVQMSKLLNALVVMLGLGGAWLIWSDIVPALTLLREYPVWPGIAPETLSLGSLVMALVATVITLVATKNVPGLLEMTLLKNLPVDAGARFAITTIFRYLLAFAGISIVANCLGITWSTVQWLVAAMGIGLGFGLQEIFANFISGIILLFERPIRVGDIITLGDTTGVVSRIRLRATTITDWDRKEYIVPNKDLMTGRLLNWTLTDQTNRVVIPIGVAYGSDTERARELLLQIANDHSNVMEEPAPMATFEQFGDSTLNLVLRCYLPDLSQRLGTVHQLHTSIHEAFTEANIEIAFPQQDIHIRTMVASSNGSGHDTNGKSAEKQDLGAKSKQL